MSYISNGNNTNLFLTRSLLNKKMKLITSEVKCIHPYIVQNTLSSLCNIYTCKKTILILLVSHFTNEETEEELK